MFGKKFWVVMVLVLCLVLGVTFLVWGQINWDAPQPWSERLLAEKYILPEGWEEATKGVEKIVFANSGALSGDIATYMNMLRFEELTGIKVEAIPVTPREALGKSLAILTTGDTSVHAVLIDIVLTELSPLVATGKLSPVDGFWPQEVLSLYNLDFTNQLVWNGHYYALPVTYITRPIFYRKSWLEEAGVNPPTSFAEMMDIFAKLNEIKPEGYYPLILPGVKDVWWTYLPLIYSQGGSVFRDGKYHFDSPEAKNALSWLIETIKKGYAPPEIVTWDFAAVSDFFSTGRAGFAAGLSSGCAYAFRAAPEVGMDFDVMTPPKWAPETPDEYAGKGMVIGNYMGINNAIGDNYKAAVLLFSDYLRSLEAQRNELFVEGNDSGLLYIWENAEEEIKKVDWDLAKRAAEELGISAPTLVNSIADIPGFNARHEIVLKATSEVFPPGFNEIDEVFMEMLDLAVRGEITIDEALSTVQSKAEETLR